MQKKSGILVVAGALLAISTSAAVAHGIIDPIAGTFENFVIGILPFIF